MEETAHIMIRYYSVVFSSFGKNTSNYTLWAAQRCYPKSLTIVCHNLLQLLLLSIKHKSCFLNLLSCHALC